MDILALLLALVVVGALVALLVRRLRGRPRPVSAVRPTPHVDAARARQAAARLDESAHRTVYGHIAQGRPIEAVRAYRRATGRGLQDAAVDVQALAAHPQVHSGPGVESPRPAAVQPADPMADQGPDRSREEERESDAPARQDPAGREDDAPDPDRGHTALTVPAEWSSAPAPEDPPFEVDVMRGDESIRLSSADLSPWLRDQISAMVRDGNLESAAVLLAGHSDLSVPEAFEILRRIKERRDGRSGRG